MQPDPLQWMGALTAARKSGSPVLFVGDAVSYQSEKLQHFAGQAGMNFVLFDLGLAGNMRGPLWESFKAKASKGGFGPEKATLMGFFGFFAPEAGPWRKAVDAQLADLMELSARPVGREAHELLPVVVLTPEELGRVPLDLRRRCELISCDNSPEPGAPPPTPAASVDF